MDYAVAKKLLKPVIMNGQRVSEAQRLQDIQLFAQKEISSLHPTYKRLLNPHVYKMSISDRLKVLKKKLIEECG